MDLVKLARRLFRTSVGYRYQAYRAARAYVEWYRGERDYNPETNGEFRLLARVLPDCRTVFDVGANQGDWAVRAVRANPHVALHCFEPGRAAFARLSARGLPATAVLNACGLSGSVRDASLHVHGGSDDVSSLHAPGGIEAYWGWSELWSMQTIELTTLDAYCQAAGVDGVDFVKLDVEGHEIEVLRGGAELLQDGRVACIQFEHNAWAIRSRTLVRDYFELLEPLGYRIHKVYPGGLCPVPEYHPRLEGFTQSTWFAAQPTVQGLELVRHRLW